MHPLEVKMCVHLNYVQYSEGFFLALVLVSNGEKIILYYLVHCGFHELVPHFICYPVLDRLCNVTMIFQSLNVCHPAAKNQH